MYWRPWLCSYRLVVAGSVVFTSTPSRSRTRGSQRDTPQSSSGAHGANRMHPQRVRCEGGSRSGWDGGPSHTQLEHFLNSVDGASGCRTKLSTVQSFVAERGTSPTAASLTHAGMSPSEKTIRRRFGSFRAAAVGHELSHPRDTVKAATRAPALRLAMLLSGGRSSSPGPEIVPWRRRHV